MPRVPTYDGPEVQAAPLRPPSARPLDVSSGTRAIGQGLVNLADGLDKKAERDAEAEAYDAEFKATSAWLEWDAEARKNARGQNVDQYEKSAEEWWTKAREEYGRDLSPRAKALIGRSLQQKHLSAKANVAAFAGAERERHADEVAMADITTTIQFGVTSGTLDATKQQVNEKVARFGARKGWTTEQVQAAQAKFVSSMHIAAIDKLDAEEGLAYFTANVDEIEYDKQGDLRKHLERNIEVEAARREAEAEKAKREAEERLLDSAWGLYAQNQPVPPSVLAALPGREAAQLANAIESRAAREAAGKTVVTDMGTYLDVRDAIGRGEPVDLRRYEGAISPSDLKSLAGLQGRASQEGFLTDEERKTKALLDLGIDKKKSPDEAYQVLSLIDERVREASSAKGGKDLTPDEKQAVIDGVVLDRVYVDDWGTDSEKLAPLLEPDEVEAAYVIVNDKRIPVSAVPADKRMEIIRARRARGLPVTEQAIVETFMAKYPGGASGGW